MADKIPTSPVFYNKQDEPKKQGFQNKPGAPTAPVFFNTPAERKQIDYTFIYNDMQKNYQTYYNAFNGNVTQYNNMLNFTGYMAGMKEYKLPEQYTRNAQAYGELLMNPTKYTEILGSAKAYKSGLQSAKELFGIENQTTGHLMDLMDKSSVPNWTAAITQAPELGQMFQYDPTNSDDILLQSVGYAPTSFSDKFSQSKIEKMQQSGYSADMYYSLDTEQKKSEIPFIGGLLDSVSGLSGASSAYLSQLYKYDLSDPEDVMNKALGLMPKSFKYDNTPEDEARQALGQLPLAAETYANNSKEFWGSYLTYTGSMQKYVDEKAAYDATPWISHLFADSPQAPKMPEVVARVQQYYDETAIGADSGVMVRDYTTKTGYADYGDTEIGVPWLYLPENKLPINSEEFTPSEYGLEIATRTKNRDISQGEGFVVGSWRRLVDRVKEKYGEDKQGEKIEEMKASGEWDKLMAEQKQIDDTIAGYLGEDSEYSPEKSKYLMENIDFMTNIGGTYGAEQVSNTAYASLANVGAEQKTNYATNDYSNDPVIQSISKEIESSGLLGSKIVKTSKDENTIWVRGEKVDANEWNLGALQQAYLMMHGIVSPEYSTSGARARGEVIAEALKQDPSLGAKIEELMSKANYRVMQKQRTEILAEREELKKRPAWEIAIGEGAASGLMGYTHSRIAAGAGYFKGVLGILGQDTTGIDTLADWNAKQWQGENEQAQYNISLGTGDPGVAGDVYNLTNMIATMAPDLWQASMIPVKSGDTAKALSIWQKLGNKLKMSRTMAPFFTSSFGYNMMQGELQGKGDAENLTASLASAYFESVLEQSFGFFSEGKAGRKLLSNGIKKLPMQTLKNIGRAASSHILGEAIEENLQNISTNLINNAVGYMMNNKYDPRAYGDIINPTEMWQTTKTTVLTGILLFGLSVPDSFKSHSTAKQAESSFNAAVEAYTAGDMAGFDANMSEFAELMDKTLSELKLDMDDGSLKKYADVLEAADNFGPALDEMYNAVQEAAGLRSEQQNMDIPEWMIAEADARANESINNIRELKLGKKTEYTSLYDQVMNSRELTQMATSKGFTAELIGQSTAVLNDSQIELLKKIEAAAQSNPNINVKFSADTTVETLQKRAAKYGEKETGIQAEFKSLNDSVTQQLRDAYNNSPKEGKAKYKELADNGTFKRLVSLRKTADKAGQRLADATAKTSAYNAQQGFKQMFDMAARGETIAPENVRPQEEQQPAQAPVSPVAGTSQRIEQTPPAIESPQGSTGAQAQNRTIAYDGSINDIVGSAKPSERVKKTAESAKGRESINVEWSGLREDEKIAKVLGSTKQAKPPLKESLREGINALRRQITDTGQAIWDFGKEIKDDLLYPMYNHAKQSAFAAQSMIGTAQRDMDGNIVGPSLMEIYKPITDAGVENRVLADTYVYHLHNIDRMSLESRAMQEYADYVNETIGEDALSDEELATLVKQEGPDAVMFKRLQELRNNIDNVKNKPVFGEGITAAVSERMIAEMDAQNPELKQFAEQLIAYHRDLLQLKLDTHMISQEEFDYLTNKYPHYVPTDRYMPTTKGMYALGRSISIADTIRVAKGSNLDLMPLDESSARKTIRDLEAINKNLLGIRLFNDAMDNPDTAGRYVEAVEVETSDYDPDTEETQKPALPNSLTFYMDGEKVTMKVSAPMFFAFNEMTNTFKEYNILTRASEAVNTVFKQLITGYNPVFSARNGIRDLSSAGLNTKFSEAMFAKNWAIAALEVATPKLSPYKGEMWQLYKSMGGIGDTFFDYKTGKIKAPSQSNIVNIAKKVNPVHLIEVANMAIEQLPRMAEFMATLESGGMSYENKIQALYNAAEVTVNFGRSGKAARFLNKTFVPFLNPSIQGASRFVRRFTETKGSKQWMSLIGRVAALGVLPSVINALLYSGDDEWDTITDRDKNRYYMFKLGDGYWLQIPKGREVSIFGAISNQLLGLQDTDVGGIINLAAEQVAPVSPLESNILSPWLQAANNKTWYDTPIENESMQSLAPGQRYDESTDAFSKWLGSVTNWSPKKTNYIIDAYTGVIGDFLLPLSTPKAEQGGILAPVISAFTLDVKTTNKLSTQFYDEVEQIKYRMNGTDKRDAAKAKAEKTIIQRYVSDISELNKLVHETQNSNIPDAEKLAKVRDLRATIAGLQKEALDRLKK